jgi:hypothetical protein
MLTVNGKNGIIVSVVADSIYRGKRMTTLELTYHRYLHSECMTHRALSKNASSSRAIPLATAINQVKENPAIPIHFGAKQAGMQADSELSGYALESAILKWNFAMENALQSCKEFDELGGHKQWAARPLEPFQMIKVVCSGTDWGNFLWLRDHEAALPEIQELAQCVRKAFDESVPFKLNAGEWHLPYVNSCRTIDDGGLYYWDNDGNKLTLDQARRLSASCCAQISYRKNDNSMEKADAIFQRLIEGDRVHSSPAEHQATPIPFFTDSFDVETWDDGITHVRRDGTLCSGNLAGWIQFRQLIPNNVWVG